MSEHDNSTTEETDMPFIPRTYWTKYRVDDGTQWVCIWRQWFRWTWNATHFRVSEAL